MHFNHADTHMQEIHNKQDHVCTVRMSGNDGGKKQPTKQQHKADLKMLLLNAKAVAYRMMTRKPALFMLRKLHLGILSWIV